MAGQIVNNAIDFTGTSEYKENMPHGTYPIHIHNWTVLGNNDVWGSGFSIFKKEGTLHVGGQIIITNKGVFVRTIASGGSMNWSPWTKI